MNILMRIITIIFILMAIYNAMTRTGEKIKVVVLSYCAAVALCIAFIVAIS